MKHFIVVVAFSFLSLSRVHAKSLVCIGSVPAEAIIGGIETLKIQANNFQGDVLKEVIAAVKFEDFRGPNLIHGRRDALSADRNYKPRAYPHHWRFNLAALTDSKDFGPFEPGDSCQISLIIPFTAVHSASFAAPALIRCDQSGGSITLQCQLR